jgi:PAS domain S-box-containing protein
MSDPEAPASGLRQRALAALDHVEPGAAGVEQESVLHELRVHQIELEMQNEELRASQRELEASRQRWFELFDLAPVGYCTLSERGLILQANLAAADLIGLPRAALPQRRFSEFVEPDDQSGFHVLLAALARSDDPQSCELRMPGTTKLPHWIQISATAVRGADDARSLRIVLMDVTARRQAEAATAALKVAERVNQVHNEFLSRVSHELRTPLNAILGFSYLLLRNEQSRLSPKARDQLLHVQHAGKHLLNMVSDLLDITRAASGRLALQITSVEVVAALRQAVAELDAQSQLAGVTVSLDAPDDLVAHVNTDATRLRQILQNLLSNAIKYNRPGGSVRAQVSRHGAYWRIHVIDNGLGMTQEQQSSLFQPFNRLGRDAAGIEGTGLGLVITRDIVKNLGGFLSLHSEAGVGTEFLVDLLAQDPAVDQNGPADDTALQVRTGKAGRVLCVENDLASRELLTSILERRPALAPEMVPTGAACIAAARRAWPDVLVLEQHLADMPGLNVLKVLHQLNPHLTLRCLVLSDDGSPDNVAQARLAGADELLVKPINAGQMLSTIDRLLG